MRIKYNKNSIFLFKVLCGLAIILNPSFAIENKYDVIRLDQNIRTLDVYTLDGSLKQLGKIIELKDFENKTIRLIKSPKPRFDWVYEIEIYDEEGQYIDNYFSSKNNLKDQFKVVSTNQVVEDLNEINTDAHKLGVVDNTDCIQGKEKAVSSTHNDLKEKQNREHQVGGVNFSTKELNCFDNALSKKSDVYNKFYRGCF